MAKADSKDQFEKVRFPGRAGELQRAGGGPSFARELGENYGTYHAFLRDELARVGRPDRGDFDDANSYFEACTVAMEIVQAEAFLRVCRGWRKHGRPLASAIDGDTPLVDSRDRLVSVE